jgi:hypothetical protein
VARKAPRQRDVGTSSWNCGQYALKWQRLRAYGLYANISYNQAWVPSRKETHLWCCGRLFITSTKYDINELRKEGFLLAHGFGGFSPSLWRGCGRAKQLSLWQPKCREREYLDFQAFSFFHFYSIQVSSLWDCAAHFQDSSSPLVNRLWKCPHGHTQMSALLIS